jgi:hypothetical protein
MILNILSPVEYMWVGMNSRKEVDYIEGWEAKAKNEIDGWYPGLSVRLRWLGLRTDDAILTVYQQLPAIRKLCPLKGYQISALSSLLLNIPRNVNLPPLPHIAHT